MSFPPTPKSLNGTRTGERAKRSSSSAHRSSIANALAIGNTINARTLEKLPIISTLTDRSSAYFPTGLRLGPHFTDLKPVLLLLLLFSLFFYFLTDNS